MALWNKNTKAKGNSPELEQLDALITDYFKYSFREYSMDRLKAENQFYPVSEEEKTRKAEFIAAADALVKENPNLLNEWMEKTQRRKVLPHQSGQPVGYQEVLGVDVRDGLNLEWVINMEAYCAKQSLKDYLKVTAKNSKYDDVDIQVSIEEKLREKAAKRMEGAEFEKYERTDSSRVAIIDFPTLGGSLDLIALTRDELCVHYTTEMQTRTAIGAEDIAKAIRENAEKLRPVNYHHYQDYRDIKNRMGDNFEFAVTEMLEAAEKAAGTKLSLVVTNGYGDLSQPVLETLFKHSTHEASAHVAGDLGPIFGLAASLGYYLEPKDKQHEIKAAMEQYAVELAAANPEMVPLFADRLKTEESKQALYYNADPKNISDSSFFHEIATNPRFGTLSEKIVGFDPYPTNRTTELEESTQALRNAQNALTNDPKLENLTLLSKQTWREAGLEALFEDQVVIKPLATEQYSAVNKNVGLSSPSAVTQYIKGPRKGEPISLPESGTFQGSELKQVLINAIHLVGREEGHNAQASQLATIHVNGLFNKLAKTSDGIGENVSMTLDQIKDLANKAQEAAEKDFDKLAKLNSKTHEQHKMDEGNKTHGAFRSRSCSPEVSKALATGLEEAFIKASPDSRPLLETAADTYINNQTKNRIKLEAGEAIKGITYSAVAKIVGDGPNKIVPATQRYTAGEHRGR